jgi:DNA-binding CsgD family transcriptional regulator/tetratricopeptide (TPR) repeat protein
MMGSMVRRLSSPIFVGRANELRMLLAAADTAISGQAMLVLVGGEAGVGKSRLVAEVMSGLHDQGWLVLAGGTVALGDEGMPFGPIVEALRALVREVDPDRIAVAAGPGLTELARLVPELSATDGQTPGPTAQSEWLQIRIFDALLRMLGRLAETSPVLLVIEDLHWADRSTRDLLAYLARNGRDERVLIIATFRTDELHRRHPLTRWLAEAERQPRVERVDVGRFERSELVELLTGISGERPSPSLVDSIARRSDGNAFFAEELLAAFDATDSRRERLPETLRDVLLVRLATASESAQRLVQIAAVAGHEVDHEILADVCGLTEGEMVAALYEAVSAQLLVADRDETAERYHFRHALSQEAAYDELLPAERRRLHGAYASALAARPGGGGAASASRLVELAHHWLAAHDSKRALDAAIAAGDASLSVFAYAEAARQFERAIDLWDDVPATDRPTERDLGDLYDAAGGAATLAGDASRGINLAGRAIELIDGAVGQDGDLERRARARDHLGFAAMLAGDTATSIKLLEEAVALLADSPPTLAQARVLAGLSANLMLAGRSTESFPFAERAIESARTIGDRAIESRALNVLGVDRASLGDIGGGIDLLRESLAVADPVADPSLIPRGHTNLSTVLEMGGFDDEAVKVALAGAQSSDRYGNVLSFRTFLEVNAASSLIELGRYREAGELLDGNLPRVRPGLWTIQLFLGCALLDVRLGDLIRARARFEVARSEAGELADAQYVIELHAVATEIALWEGDPAAAVTVALEGLDRVVGTDAAMILGQLVLPAVQAAADHAVRARAARDAESTAAAVEAAGRVIEHFRAAAARLTSQDDIAKREIGWRMTLCDAELARATGDDDPANWLLVKGAIATRSAPFRHAYVRWRIAEALASRGETGAAAAPLREANTIIRGIGAPLLGANIESLARRLRVDLTPMPDAPMTDLRPAVTTPSSADVASEPADPFGLTTREREVLALVAEGYTNRRIADELFISESTAGVHVSHILGKLGVDTRTEAAAVAVRLGLDRALRPS